MNGSTPPPADLLLPRVAQGDAAAVRECISRYGGLIWSLAKRLAISDVEAEDAVQDVFVEVWKNADRYDASIASETAFIAMIARRRLIDRRRKIGRMLDTSTLSDAVAAEAKADGWRGGPPEGSATDKTFAAEEVRRASGALDQLSPDQQRVLRLSIYRGLSHELISRSLAMPLGTVKTHARRGLIRLRQLLGAPEKLPGEPRGGGEAGADAGGGAA